MADPEAMGGSSGSSAVTVRAGGVQFDIPASELEWRFSASSGPGGQHVNTSNTRADVRFDIAASASVPEEARSQLIERLGPVVQVVAGDRRSQARNRELAIERLRARLEDALRVEPPRRPTRPTAASRRQRQEAKRRTSERKRERRPPAADPDE